MRCALIGVACGCSLQTLRVVVNELTKCTPDLDSVWPLCCVKACDDGSGGLLLRPYHPAVPPGAGQSAVRLAICRWEAVGQRQVMLRAILGGVTV